MDEFNHIVTKLVSVDQLAIIREKHPTQTIGYMCGCFDIFHIGHSIYFSQGKKHSDILVVGIGRDSVLRELKGDSRPVNTELNRALVVAAHQDVDYCVLQEELDTQEKKDLYAKTKIDCKLMLEVLRPNVFITSQSSAGENTKRSMCESLGISYIMVPRETPSFIEPTSSTAIIEKVKLN